MASQTLLCTVMPRGISLNPTTLPVSVYVAPRLFGDTRLGAFPDWLNWPQLLKDYGLALTLRSGTHNFTAEIATDQLRPALWAAMFKEDTLVRSHTFDDYSERAIFSYPLRLALSTLKSAYQQAGLLLALPDRAADDSAGQERRPSLPLLKGLLDGLQVNWTDEVGERLRKQLRDLYRRLPSGAFAVQFQASQLGADGLLKTMPAPGTTAARNFNQAVALQFAVFNHVPPGQPIERNPPDFKNLLDFHQALSALNSYPELMRALGLVFDLELPRDFVAVTPLNNPSPLSVTGIAPGWEWAIAPAVPPLITACLHAATGPNAHIFLTAPGFIAKLTPDLETLGLLNLDGARFGLAQVDVDGGMHKAIMLAETIQDGRPGPAAPDHPEVFDPTATLPALRSGGLSLYADARAARLLNTFKQSTAFNTALNQNKPQPRPFYAEDLIHGYRLDIWDSHTGKWHSLHRRNGHYTIEEEVFETTDEEGFVQLAATQAAPNPDHPPANDLYLHEAMARWAGWSLSAPWPGKHLTRSGDPDQAIPDANNPDPENVPATPFQMTTAFKAFPGSLPALRFGRRYRLRARVVDLCGNSLKLGEPLTDALAAAFGLPLDAEGFVYLRYEPVASPLPVLRDTRSVTDPGSALERLVIRTFNAAPAQDAQAADRTASDRHIVPPHTSVEVGERLGMFDDAAGKLVGSKAMYDLIAARDAGELNQIQVAVAGKQQKFPLEAGERIDVLPYLPDVLARGAALRDLPGTPAGSIGRVAPGGDPPSAVNYAALNDPNPRPGSATLVSFNGEGDWQKLLPFRLALDEGNGPPQWDAATRVLTVFMAKGTMKTVPLTSYLDPGDLKLMGVWQWLREHIENVTTTAPEAGFLRPGADVDQIAHILQRAIEGGHWMLTPPRLLTFVSAVQQPIGVPAFAALPVQHEAYDEKRPDPDVLQTQLESQPTAETELNAITAWRKPGAIDAFLLGGLQVHAASTAKVELLAEWIDPVDDLNKTAPRDEHYRAPADEIPISRVREGLISVTPNFRRVAYYDADHDLLCFVRAGDALGNLKSGVMTGNAAPRHHFNDTKHHRVRYTARATSRYREYFPQDQALDFTRTSAPVEVDVPASARPVAPQIAYVVPTFGWQRQTETNLKRSIRFGGGLRVYLERPWYSSGAGELLGVTLYNGENGVLNRDRWKSFITQWGIDPIWQTAGLLSVPGIANFPDRVAWDFSLSLEERAPGRVDVAGHRVAYDEELQKWYCDLTVNTETLTYAPFIRLALVRYQPHALADAKLSNVVLADFAQLTPERAAVVTADPYHPRRLRVTVSGIAPTGPTPSVATPPPADRINTPTRVEITLQERDATMTSDLAWNDVPAGVATINEQHTPGQPALIRWTGTVEFAQRPEADRFRLLIREYEYVSANYTLTEPQQPGTRPLRHQPRRLIYAETIAVDTALIAPPAGATGTVVD